MAPRSSHPFEVLARHFAEIVADRVATLMPKGSRDDGASSSSKLSGRKLEMRCRFPGCKNRSKGPRFRFLCEEHLKLPKAEQKAALEKWAAKTG